MKQIVISRKTKRIAYDEYKRNNFVKLNYHYHDTRQNDHPAYL